MSFLRPLALAIIAVLWLAASARAYTYGDTLTLIMRPLPNLPAIVRPGDDVTVWANAPSTVTNWTASIELPSTSVSHPLTSVSWNWEPLLLRWNLVFRIPNGIGEEIYDLRLACDACVTDVTRHSVKVIPAFKTSFYFAQISDTHVPSHTFSSSGGFSTADTSGMADFNAVIDDLNLIHPEFILHTGDLVNEGELEEYLAMHEMGRAQGMFSRLRDPIFVVSGNHDQGGWDPTPPPEGTARRAWWRTFGWRFLLNPPPGDPHHSQDYSFDYGNLHCIGLESYINNGSYDDWHPEIWGAQSFTTEQMSWLADDIAAAPYGSTKLAFYHYDFGGTQPNGSPGPNFSQINPQALGLDGAIYGHNHGIAEGNRTARPFNLGVQSVIDRRAFRMFRYENGLIYPGPMHRSGGTSQAPTESLTVTWSGPNDGTRGRLTGTITNRFGEPWEHGRLVFYLANHDSIFACTGGTIAQTRWQGAIAVVYVNVAIPASGTVVVAVTPVSPANGVPGGSATFRLDPLRPNPFRPEQGALDVHFSLRAAGHARLTVYDLEGRVVQRLLDGALGAGRQNVLWNGRDAEGHAVRAGVYVVALEAGKDKKRRKVSVMR